jgi:hypothetical protein
MIGTELLTKFQELTPEELLLPVRVYADHGQCAMTATEVSIGLLMDDGYMGELVNQEDFPDYKLSQCIVIDA